MGGWKDVSQKERVGLLKRRMLGVPVHVLASEVDMKATTLARRLREMAADKTFKESVITKSTMKFGDWSKGPELKAKYIAVTGDLQMPYLDYELAERMLLASERILPEGKRHLIIAGDMMNMDVFSRFPALHASTPSFETEISHAKTFLEDAKDVFGDNIHVLMGNHEMRVFFKLIGHLDMLGLGKLVSVKNVNWYNRGWMVVHSGGKTWRVTHQKNYSISAQAVGIKLAHKFQQNIMAHHQHKMSKGYDTSGKLVVVDNGCLVDPSKLDYANIIDTTSPAMNQGFSVIRNGAVTMFSKDDVFTDWELAMK